MREILRLKPFEIEQFSNWFIELAETGRIKGVKGAEFLKKSGLPTVQLKQVLKIMK
jgi:hypothetical protein